jgi:isopenicillin N synthase-like dioxygenase
MPDQVPVIDFAPFRDGDRATRQRLAREVGRACEDIGFFILVGHGVDPALVRRTADTARDFFDLPYEEKMRIRRPAPEQNRGYNGMGQEALSYSIGRKTPPDLKEFLSIGPVDVPDEPYYRVPDAYPHFAPNLWPERPADLRPTWEAYWRRLNRLADALMQCFALALDLPEDFFADKLDRNISMFRVLNYPDQPDDPQPDQLRAGEHTDYGTLTILKSENVPGGLQVKTRQGAWVDVVAPEDSFVVNIGDLMMIWTNDRFVSTPHRVVNPPRDARLGTRRQSMPFFHQPNYDALIECLPSCRGSGAKHAPITSGAHRLGKFLRASQVRAGL